MSKNRNLHGTSRLACNYVLMSPGPCHMYVRGRPALNCPWFSSFLEPNQAEELQKPMGTL